MIGSEVWLSALFWPLPQWAISTLPACRRCSPSHPGSSCSAFMRLHARRGRPAWHRHSRGGQGRRNEVRVLYQGKDDLFLWLKAANGADPRDCRAGLQGQADAKNGIEAVEVADRRQAEIRAYEDGKGTPLASEGGERANCRLGERGLQGETDAERPLIRSRRMPRRPR